MSNNVQHRPPHAEFKINELIKLGKFDEAEECIDVNLEFYRKKEQEQQELWRRVAAAKIRSARTGEHARPLGKLLEEEEHITPPPANDEHLPAFLRRQAD